MSTIICLGASYTNFIFSNSKLKFSFILVVYNDHVVDLLMFAHVGLTNLVTLAYMYVY